MRALTTVSILCLLFLVLTHELAVSWYNQGYPSVSIDESGPSDTYLNPYYHTASDTIDRLDFTKASKFVKVSCSGCYL
jgi:hypothetical protein